MIHARFCLKAANIEVAKLNKKKPVPAIYKFAKIPKPTLTAYVLKLESWLRGCETDFGMQYGLLTFPFGP